MAGNESQVVGAELERVLPKVPTLFDRDDVFYSALEKRPVEVISARDMRIPLELKPGGKTGYYNPDGGDMGRGDMPTFDKALINSVHLRHAVEFTSKTMWATDNNRKAVINAFRHNLATGMKEFRRNVDSYCMTAGNGVLGTITTVSNAGGFDTYTMTTDGFGARLIRYGMNVNVYNAALSTNRTAAGEVSVSYVDIPTKTIKVPTVTNSAPTDVIVASGLSATPPVGMLGVPYHASNSSVGMWLQIDRAANPEVRANGTDGGGVALTLPAPRLAINKIGDRLGINENSKLTAWTHPAQKAAYEELAQNVIRIDKSSREEDVNLYFSHNMRMAGAPLKCSYSWDRTRIDFIDMDVLGRAELHPAGFYQNPDNNQRVWEIRGTTGGVATSWIFYIVASFNMYASNPAGLSYIYNLKPPTGY